ADGCGLPEGGICRLRSRSQTSFQTLGFSFPLRDARSMPPFGFATPWHELQYLACSGRTKRSYSAMSSPSFFSCADKRAPPVTIDVTMPSNPTIVRIMVCLDDLALRICNGKRNAD